MMIQMQMNSTSQSHSLEIAPTIVGAPSCFVLNCPVCEQKNWRPALRVRFSQLFQCAQCGLIATGNFVLGNTNPDQIYEVGPENHRLYRQWYLENRLRSYQRVIPTLEVFRHSGRLLEIGSAYGYFLEYAARFKWHAEGVELAAYPCEVARSKGCHVIQGKLEDAKLEQGAYDIVMMWDVIEHLTDVGKVLERSFELLRSGGALIARTPDGRALFELQGLLGSAYRNLAYPANTAEHVFHFTPANLSLLLGKKGYGQCKTDASVDWQEIIIGGRNSIVRLGRSLIFRVAFARNWPYEFVITAVKP